MDQLAAETRARVLERYAAAQSYRDTGEHTTVFVSGPSPWQRRTSLRPFRTQFVRPDKFFFEYRDAGVGPKTEWQHGFAWQTSASAHAWTWNTFDLKLAGPWPLSKSLGALAGVSGGTSWAVPRLLGAIGEREFLPPALAHAGDETFEGARCVVLEGERSPGERLRFWFDCSEFLLRRMDGRRSFDEATHLKLTEQIRDAVARHTGDAASLARMQTALEHHERSKAQHFVTESTTIWRPEIDVMIEASVFDFTPPNADG